ASRSATRTPAARSGRRGERTLADPLQHLVLREELLRFLELVARFLRPAELPQHLDDVRRNLGVLEDFPRAPELYQRFVELALAVQHPAVAVDDGAAFRLDFERLPDQLLDRKSTR